MLYRWLARYGALRISRYNDTTANLTAVQMPVNVWLWYC